MDPAALHHEKVASQWEDNYKKSSFRRRMDVIFSVMNESDIQGRDWLDAGCGAGVLSMELVRRGAKQVVGIDGSPKMIDAAIATASKMKVEEDLLSYRLVKDLQPLEYETATFDGVLSSSVVEYAADPVAAAKEMARVLKPGGILVISVPNAWALRRNMRELRHRTMKLLTGKPRTDYLTLSKNAYRPHSFKNMLKSVGLVPGEPIYTASHLPNVLIKTALGGNLMICRAEKPGQPGIE